MPKFILLVDDNPRVRHGMRRAFESSGFTVSEAEDGEKAVKHVGRYTPDVIVLDLAMPIMNGLQAAPSLSRPCRLVEVRSRPDTHEGGRDGDDEERQWRRR